jgi:hypothetical protein
MLQSLIKLRPRPVKLVSKVGDGATQEHGIPVLG